MSSWDAYFTLIDAADTISSPTVSTKWARRDSGPQDIESTENVRDEELSQHAPSVSTETIKTEKAESADNTALVSNFKKVPSLLDGELFEIMSERNGNFVFICKNCPGMKTISGTMTSTGNFISHIKRVHPQLVKRMEEKRIEDRPRNHKASSWPISHKDRPKAKSKKQPPKSLQTYLHKESKFCVTQKQALEVISNYVIKEMLPLATVEKPSFCTLVSTISKANPVKVNAPDRKTFTTNLKERMHRMKDDLKELFALQDYVCTTADIWSEGNMSYLGMTGHFIDSDSFERKSFALACRRVKFQSSFDKIVDEIHAVHEEYKIIQKVTHTVTDNTAIFGKAFRCYFPLEHIGHVEMDQEDCNGDDINITTISLDDGMVDNDSCVSMPQQLRCCSYSLNLIVTTDLDPNNMCNPAEASYVKIQLASLEKLSTFWNLLSRSMNASDLCEALCKTNFTVPNQTCWNSLYTAIQKLISVKDKLGIVFDALKIPRLKCVELEFLDEYSQVMQPLANGLDILNGEHHAYLGIILPTLLSIQKRTESFKNLVHCTILKDMILSSLEKRFHKILDFTSEESKEFLLSSISYPLFKITWVPENYIGMTRALFISACERLQKSASMTAGLQRGFPSSNDSDFFSVLNNSNGKGQAEVNTACMEALHYLDDTDKDLLMLKKYPFVMGVFMKHNTALPSSAPFERLFSAGGQLLTPRRNRLSDQDFEMLLLLRANSET